MTGLVTKAATAWLDSDNTQDREMLIGVLRALPRKWVTGFAVRCARRVTPLILRSKVSDAVERWHAAQSVLAVTDRWCSGESVSRLTLEMAARIGDAIATREAYSTFAVEYALGAAVSDPDASAGVTVGKYDPTAYTASARSTLDAARCAVEAVGRVDSGVVRFIRQDLESLLNVTLPPTADVAELAVPPLLFGPLWPEGEPAWAAAALSHVGSQRHHLPRVLDLPMNPLPASEPSELFLELNDEGKAALADENWIDEQYDLGTFDQFKGHYIAVVNKTVLGHDKKLKKLRSDVSAATGIPVNRIVTALIVRQQLD